MERRPMSTTARLAPGKRQKTLTAVNSSSAAASGAVLSRPPIHPSTAASAVATPKRHGKPSTPVPNVPALHLQPKSQNSTVVRPPFSTAAVNEAATNGMKKAAVRGATPLSSISPNISNNMVAKRNVGLASSITTPRRVKASIPLEAKRSHGEAVSRYSSNCSSLLDSGLLSSGHGVLSRPRPPGTISVTTATPRGTRSVISRTATPPSSTVCSRIASSNTAMPLSPPRAAPRQPAKSTPASRISSLNSRLGDTNAEVTGQTRLRRGVVSVQRTTATPRGVRSSAPSSARAAHGSAVVRPVLSSSRVASAGAENYAGVHQIPQAMPISVFHRLAGSRVSNAADGKGASARQQKQQPPQSLQSQKTQPTPRKAAPQHFDPSVPPIKSSSIFCKQPSVGYMQAAVRRQRLSPSQPRGPLSPIRRTSTACPQTASKYPVMMGPLEDGVPLEPFPTISSTTWIKPAASATPPRDGLRDHSEAPTIPYEGSTGQRDSVSPRTDCDSQSVSGRLSYGC